MLYKYLTFLNEIHFPHNILSYLTIISHRIYFMREKLKATGSFYLHCDPAMSHYLKIICDLIFGLKSFRNEISWQRTHHPKGSQFKDKKYGVYTDILFFYTKSDEYTFELDKIKTKLTVKEIKEKYNREDKKGRYYAGPILCSKSMGARPNLCYEYNGYKNPYPSGWRVSKSRLIEIDEKGDLGWTKNKTPFRKLRAENDRGHPIGNLWTDIHHLSSKQAESLGYPTQKPESLLERIVKASSKEGDVIADFFCGCGTTIAVAQKLNRKWIGVDISHLAIRLVYDRLLKPYKDDSAKQNELKKNIEINGFPKDIASAKDLAEKTKKGRFKFQDWIIEVVLGGVSNPKKTADGGYDGYMTFFFAPEVKDIILIEVKSGNTNVGNLRSFFNVVLSEKAAMGIFVCFEKYCTKGMQREAKSQGHYRSTRIDKIQIITIEELLKGKLPIIPISNITTFKKATKALHSKEKETLFEQ